MVLLLYSLKVNVRLMKRFLLVLLGVVNCCGLWRSRASLAFGELQYQFWNESAGMWRSSMWWQAANTVEVIANLGLASAGEKDVVLHVLDRVFNATANDTIARCDDRVDLTFSGYFDDELWWGLGWLRAYELTKDAKFLNRSRAIFDDIVNRSWTNESCGGGACWQASSDPADMRHCYKNAITNELFFSLGVRLSAVYARRCRSAETEREDKVTEATARDCDAAAYTGSWAQAELDWFVSSGMINSSSLVNDGLDTFATHPEVCMNNQRTAYTYNQGVLLSGLGELWAAHRVRGHSMRALVTSPQVTVGTQGVPLRASAFEDPLRSPSSGFDPLRLASSIVEAVWESPLVYSGTGGVLREMNEAMLEQGTLPNLYEGYPGTDGLQFKSVLLRHLRYLINAVVGASGSEGKAQEAVARAGGNLTVWRDRIARNAAVIWQRAACVPPQPYSPGASVTIPPLFGYLWMGPCAWAFGGPSATTQTSALDVFLAAGF